MSRLTALIQYTLHLADDSLILGHRNSEWTGHGPILEQDIALSNIALDLVGQARHFYQYAATLLNQSSSEEKAAVLHEGMMFPGARVAGGDNPVAGITEDDLAYLRDAWDFRNCLLVEQGNGDWAKTILRQFFFSTYQFYLYDRLRYSRDGQIAAISEKAYKEVAYHLRWSSEWVVRLGDGTAESHARLEKALSQLWKFTGELFIPAGYETLMTDEGIGGDPGAIHPKWAEKVTEIFSAANISLPLSASTLSGGKEGRHTEELGYILAEMQFLQRAYPGCEW